jgi:RNA polymerase sigma-70 factor (ECF subfamily)
MSDVERTPAVPTPAASPASLTPPTLEEVYRAQVDFVWRSVRALGVREGAIDDVVQEVFVVAQRKLPAFEGRSSLRTWLSGIVLNVVRHHRRTAHRKSPHERSGELPTDVDSLPTTAESPDDVASLREATRLLQQVLDGLDEKKREVLVLAELEGFSSPEIAKILGIGLNTVYSRLRVAREEFERLAARYRTRDTRRPA